jgi:hypothetical protein
MINGDFEVHGGKLFYVLRGPSLYHRIPIFNKPR